MEAAGIESDSTNPSGVKTSVNRPMPGGTKSGTVDADSLLSDPDLAAVVNAWPDLPESIRREILGLVGAIENILGAPTPGQGHPRAPNCRKHIPSKTL